MDGNMVSQPDEHLPTAPGAAPEPEPEPGVSSAPSAPTVSIGMPVYNGEALIRQALDSLLAQTWTDFEILISDNASTDDTPRICQEYARRDRRVRYVRQGENRGGAWNFRYVLEAAQGKYFMFAAHDDAWKPSYIEKLMQVHQTHGDVVAATSQAVFTNGEVSINTYSIVGTPGERFKQFIRRLSDNSWFYGIFDRDTLIEAFRRSNVHIYAADWSVVAHVILQGNVVEVPEVLLTRNTPKTHLGSVRLRHGVGGVFPVMPFFANALQDRNAWSVYCLLKCLLWNYRYCVKLMKHRLSNAPVALI